MSPDLRATDRVELGSPLSSNPDDDVGLRWIVEPVGTAGSADCLGLDAGLDAALVA
jgi:hypothetical protein